MKIFLSILLLSVSVCFAAQPPDPKIGTNTVWPKTTTIFTAGSVGFADSIGRATQDNAMLFWDNTNDYLGIGNNTPELHLHVSSSSASDPRGIMSAQYSTDAVGARIHMRKGRGTQAAPTIVVTGDILGRLRFSGYDGANYIQTASVDVGALGTIAATRVPSYLGFSVGTDAAPTVLTERMRILPAGNVLIGTTTSNGGLLEILSTTEAFRISYDSTRKLTLAVDASGNSTLVPSGGTFNVTGIMAASSSVSVGGSLLLSGVNYMSTTALAGRASGWPIKMSTTGYLGWSDNADGALGTIDTIMKRSSAGVMGFADSTSTSGTGSILVSNITVNGKVTVPSTITTPGTTGNQTINKMAGRVNIAAAGTTVTVTDSLVTTASIILCTIATNDGTATLKNCVPGTGSFVITLTAAATAETAVSFFVVN